MFRSASFRSRLSAVAHLPLLKTQFLKTCCAAVLLAASSQAGAVDLLVSNFTDSPDPATRGGQLVYSATITNNEADSASNATLTFALDPETTFVSVSDAGHCAYQSGAHQVSCSYPTIKGDLSGPGSADVITVNVTVASKASAGATVSASATVASVDADSNSANNALSQLTTLDNGADLALALGVSPPSVPAGASIAYTLGATNNGPNVAGATSVALTLSPNLTYQSASGSGWSCAVAAQVVTCTRASAALGALPDITVNAKVTGATTGTITSAAAVSISGSAVDYDSTNNSATANLTVSVGTDLALSKGASSNTPAAGAPMSFTLAPRNNGPFAATGVTVTDNLPAGFAVTSASGAGWSCAINGQAVTCTTASYAVGATDDITIGATAPAAVSATNYTNTAQIASATPDANAANDVASKSVTVLPDGIDLAITKTKGPNPVAEGAPVQSTIAVTNNGPQGARAGEVAVTDTLPAGETYTSYSGANWTCGAAGQVVTCTYNAALANGAKTSNLVITSSASAAGTLTNNACATYTDSVGSLVDPVGGNNCTGASVIATTAAGSIDLQLAKSVSVDPLVWNASTLSYTLTLTNAGPAGATGITLRDPIPGAVSGTGIVASQTGGSTSATFSCTNASTVVCTQTGGAALEPGETAVFTIDVSRPLKDSGAGKFTNTATVSSNAQGDTNTSNNSASVQVKVEPVADLTVSSSVTPTSAQAGTKATYVLTVNNSGPSNAAAVALTQVFTLAGGTMTFLSATPSSGSCSWDGATQALSCTLGALAASGTATVTVDVRPDYMSVPPTPRNLVADVSVASSTNETNLANNAAQTVLSITQASVDLLVNNTDSPDPLGYVPASANPTFPDNVVTFKNTVTNKGPSVASNVTLTYTMTPPAGKTITFLGDKLASTGQAYSNYCDHLNAQATAASPLTISCTLPGILAAANATTDLYLDFRVDTQPSASGDTFTSSVTVASSEPESLSVNNSVTQTTTVRMRADLQLAKSARAYIGGSDSATTTAQVRQPFYWVLTLTNAGPGDSQVTTITDTLPAGVALYTPAGGAPSPYNAAPYNAGVAWSTNNGTPTSGACSVAGASISCAIGLLDSGKVATVRIPVVSTTTGARTNCASASTSEVDPNSANNTNICSTVTVQASSIAGTVYADANNNGAKAAGEAGINNVSVTLAGTDDYGNAVNRSATTNASGAFSFATVSPGTYSLSETQPSGYQDGLDAAGTSGGNVAAPPGDAISAITLAGNTSASGYLFGELPNASLSGYVFVDANANALRDGPESSGISGITITLTGTDDLGAVNRTTTTGAAGLYTFANLRPGTYTVTEASIPGVTHTGMTVGSAGGQDGATVIAANTAVTGAGKKAVSGVVIATSATAQNYNFGESGQGLSGYVYVDLNANGQRDAGEPGIPGVSLTLSGTAASGNNVCSEISPNPCTVLSIADGSYSFTGVPASNGAGYTITEQAQTSAPLSNYADALEHAGTLGGTVGSDAISAIVVSVGDFGANYDFGEKGGVVAARVYHDKNANGSLDAGEPGLAGVTLTLSGTTASGANVCTIIPSCSATTAADGTASFAGLPKPNGSGYTLIETQPVDYAEGANTAGTGGGTPSSAAGTSTIAGIALAAGGDATGYLFGEKSGAVQGFVYADANNNGVRDAGETGIAGVTVTLAGASASGADVCTLVASCTATTQLDGSYGFANVPNAGAGGYSLTEQSQASAPLDAYLDGKLSTGSNCAGCTTTLTSPNAFNAILLDATKSYTGYNFAELAPGALSGHVYKDVDANAVQGGDEALAGITVSLTGTDDLGQAVNLTTTSAADGSYGFTKLRPSPAGYTLTETQPTSLADFAGASGTLVGKVGGVATGTAAANAASGIVLAPGQSGTGYDFRDKPASLAGRVYLDANDNAVVDGGEELIPGVTVKLTGVDADGGVVDMSTITVNGAWSFTGLKAGAYVLTETQPASHADGRESAGTAGGTVNNSEFNAAPQFNTIGAIVLAAGVDATGYAFGERPIPTSGAIGGSVFVDLNNDGRPGAGETGIANVTVRLSGRTARGELLAREIVTGKEGSWLFDNLEASDAEGYSVTEVQPADYLDGITSVGSAGGKAQGGKPVAAKGLDTIAGIVLGETVQAMGYHFGERSQGSVSGVVYFDQNGNGKQDAQESGIAAVSIALSGKDAKGAAVNLATTSGADGSFVFTSVPASDSAGYMLIEIQPSQHRDGATTIDAGSPGAAIGAKPVAAGGLDAISGIVVGAGKKLAGYRFGELGAGVQLGGRVYVQGTDTGIAGVTITLAGVDAGGATVSRSTSTDTEGRYLFDALAPSNAAGYRITEVQPAGVNDGPTVIPAGAPGKLDGAKPIGVGNSDSIAGVVMQEANRTGYDFIETAVPFLKPPVVNGYVWLDRTHDRVRPTDGSQQGLANWTVQLRQKGALICTTSTDAKGFYQFDNLHCAGYEASGLPTGSGFSVVFNKDGNRMPAVAVSGGGKGVAAPTGGQIDNLTLNPGDAVVEQNLPLDPAGVVYDAVTRKPVAGAVVTISGPAGFNVNTHLVGGTAAQAQTVGADGMYQFLLQNDFPSGVYALAVSVPAGYLPAPSSTIPPCVGTPKVGLVPTPALVQASDGAPALSVPLHKPGACVGMVAGGAPTTQYYQSFVITNGGSAPILNNHMPIDPIPVDGLVLAKTTPLVNVARGDLVPYTIVATNSRAQALPATVVQDMLPPGFQYKAGSARMNGAPAEPKLAGRTLSFAARGFAANEKATYTLILAVGAGVGDGEYVNRAVAVSPATGAPVSNTATAAVRIVPDATFDCPDVIGKVFDDANVNGVQDEGEAGLPGIRLATPRGLLITTDAQGRYHVPCAEIPNADRGANFVMKLDERTLPSGYRVTTENPGSVRITRGKLAKLNFGAAIHRVVRIEAGDTAFEPGSATLLPQWNQQLDTMIEQLKARPSVVRIALRQGADSALSARRMQALREAIAERWRRQGGAYALAVEEEGVQ